MKTSCVLVAAIVSLSVFVKQVEAQTVPYFAFGVGVGNLNTLEASGHAWGWPLGPFSFEADPTMVTQTAFDGSFQVRFDQLKKDFLTDNCDHRMIY